MKMSGSLIQAYIICPRQAWLMSRQISGDQNNEFLSIGRFYSENTYNREKKEVEVAGNKIDILKDDNGKLTVIEVKKSSKMIKASKMQLLNYLYSLSLKGYVVAGEIRIPKEKKVIKVDFSEKEIEKIESLHKEINEIIDLQYPPKENWIGACRSCSYSEFCWS